MWADERNGGSPQALNPAGGSTARRQLECLAIQPGLNESEKGAPGPVPRLTDASLCFVRQRIMVVGGQDHVAFAEPLLD